MGCSKSKQHEPSRAPAPAPPPQKLSPRLSLRRSTTQPPSSRKQSGQANEMPAVYPHYKLDDLMRSADHFTENKHRQGHPGALMLARQVHTYRVLLTGIADSGKTRLLYTLINGSAQEPCETEGFREEVLYVSKGTSTSPRINFTMVDLGGQQEQRDLHIDRAVKGCAGIIFVVDSSSPETFPEARKWFEALLGRPDTVGLPVLLLANKGDLPEAVSVEEVEEAMGVADVTNRRIKAFRSSIDECDHVTTSMGLVWLGEIMEEDKHVPPTLSKPKSWRSLRM